MSDIDNQHIKKSEKNDKQIDSKNGFAVRKNQFKSERTNVKQSKQRDKARREKALNQTYLLQDDD